MNEGKVSVQSDKAGIASAVLCMIHCLVVPVFFLSRYWLADGGVLHGLPEWWDKLDYLFLAISFWAVYHSAGHTSSRPVKRALWFFWGVLALSIVFEATIHWMAYPASFGLIAAHFVNIRRLRSNYKAYEA